MGGWAGHLQIFRIYKDNLIHKCREKFIKLCLFYNLLALFPELQKIARSKDVGGRGAFLIFHLIWIKTFPSVKYLAKCILSPHSYIQIYIRTVFINYMGLTKIGIYVFFRREWERNITLNRVTLTKRGAIVSLQEYRT